MNCILAHKNYLVSVENQSFHVLKFLGSFAEELGSEGNKNSRMERKRKGKEAFHCYLGETKQIFYSLVVNFGAIKFGDWFLTIFVDPLTW